MKMKIKMKMKMKMKVGDDDGYLVMKVIQSLKLSSDESYNFACSNVFTDIHI